MKPSVGRTGYRRLLKRVLGGGRHRLHSVLAMAGFVFGLVLLLGSLNIALGIYRATRRGQDYAEYLIVNKQVTMGGLLTHIRPTFTEQQIEELWNQPFVADLGAFKTAQFRVSSMPEGASPHSDSGWSETPGGVNGGFGMDLPFYTDLFLESVPDRFLDLRPKGWQWTPESDFLPIIMSREFLNIYNFSFALAQGLPQIPESLVGAVSGVITVSGPGGRRRMRARVVGLSDRIPSIIVPESFMDWANSEIAETSAGRPSRLLIETDRPADPGMLDYFQRRGLQVNSERLRAGRIGRMAMLALSAVGGVGMLFVALALVLLVLVSRLLLSESGPRIRLLLHLGYSPAMVVAQVLRRTWLDLTIVGVIAGGILAVVFPFVYQRLRDGGFEPGPALLPTTMAAGAMILAFTAVVNLISVRNAIYRQMSGSSGLTN